MTYKPNSKQVFKRTITLKQAFTNAAQAVKDTISKVADKSKQIKQEYVCTKQKVGTQTVDQLTFVYNHYK